MSTPASFDFGDLVAETIWRDQVESTNSYLSQLAPTESSRIVATWNQTGGRGRLGREWVSPAGKSLAFSIELWPELVPQPIDTSWLGSLSLLTAASLASAISDHLTASVSIKWPNDVLIEGKKVAGILGEIPQPGRVVVGVGLNVWLDQEELPVSWATSLRAHGVTSEEIVASIGKQFVHTLHDSLTRAQQGLGDELSSWITDQLETIGQRVRVEFPDGASRTGMAEGIDSLSRLLVRFADTGEVEPVDSADIWHLRPER